MRHAGFAVFIECEIQPGRLREIRYPPGEGGGPVGEALEAQERERLLDGPSLVEQDIGDQKSARRRPEGGEPRGARERGEGACHVDAQTGSPFQGFRAAQEVQ